MWNCNWGFPFAQGGWFMGHGPFGMLTSIFIIAFVFYLAVLLTRWTVTRYRKMNNDTNDSIEIIKNKYARGEITEEEFLRMKEILTGLKGSP